MIRKHPKICTPDEKEIRFFDRNNKYKKGIKFYKSKFKKCSCEKEIGEASPPYWNRGITLDEKGNYRFDEKDDPPTRIKKHYPNIKLIFSLRNPIDRIYSQFWKNVRQGREKKRSVVEAVKEEIDGKRDHRKDELCWIYRNSYKIHLKKWKSMYEERKIKVVLFEEWTSNIDDGVGEVFDFLGVDKRKVELPEEEKNKSRVPRSDVLRRVRDRYLGESLLGKAVRWVNQSEGRPTPSESERAWLFDVLEDEIKGLEELLGRSLDIWYPDKRS
jgi:hypothetical protein